MFDKARLSQIWLLPNLITVLRMTGIPVFVWLLFGAQDRLSAALLLGGLGATDWVDGYLARKLNQESNLGRILDPTADRLLVLAAIHSLLVDDSAPTAFMLVSLIREYIIVAAVPILLAIFRIDTVVVNWYGKAGTLALFAAFPLFLLSNSDVPSGVSDTTEILAWVFGIPGLVLSYFALAKYIPAVYKQIKKPDSK